MIQFKTFCFNAFQENTYLIWNAIGEGVVVDPGCYSYEERKEITDFIDSNQIKLQAIINTHAHIDHVLGVAYFKEHYQLPFGLHQKEQVILTDVVNRAQVYGFPHYQQASVDFWIESGKELAFGELRFQVLFVPGHAPGHLAFYLPEDRLLFAGDVLFRRSVGRTDFPLCSHEDLVNSIETQFYTLPDDVIVFPGHGKTTTIGEEKALNPYVRMK